MARGVNKVILVGNLGQKPEMRYTQTNTASLHFQLQHQNPGRIKILESKERKLNGIRVVFFGKLAEIAEQYLDKGSQALC